MDSSGVSIPDKGDKILRFQYKIIHCTVLADSRLNTIVLIR
jgi:hypothetical protein